MNEKEAAREEAVRLLVSEFDPQATPYTRNMRKVDAYRMGVRAGFDAGYDAGRAVDNESGWVRTDERLPDESGEYLVRHRRDNVVGHIFRQWL